MSNAMSFVMLKTAVKAMKENMESIGMEVNATEVADIVMNHAAGAAACAVASGIIPGVGGVVAMGIASSAVLAMYVRLASVLGIRLRKGLLRALATGLVADIAAYLATTLVVSAAVSFIPFVGNMSAAMLTAISNFGCVYLAGLIFIKMLDALMQEKRDIFAMSDEEMRQAARVTMKSIDMKAALKESRGAYKQAEAEGRLHQERAV